MTEFTFTSNPKGPIDPYLAGLNEAFGGWGDRNYFRWSYERNAGAGVADLIWGHMGGELCAGSAVVYRRAHLSDGSILQVGIMSGSWTLPRVRRHGCFAKMIDEALALCRNRGAALLVAFVTEDNPSRRRLQAAGATMIPAAYCVAPAVEGVSPVDPTSARIVDPVPLDSLSRRFADMRQGSCSFDYPGPSQWQGQMLDRAQPVHVMDMRGATAVIEHGEDTDRLLTLVLDRDDREERRRVIDTLRRQSSSQGRAFFFYSTRTEDFAYDRGPGMNVINGYFTVLPVEPGAPAVEGPWLLESGDRM